MSFGRYISYKFRLLNWFRSTNFIVSRESTGFANDPEEGKYLEGIHVYDSTANNGCLPINDSQTLRSKTRRCYLRFNRGDASDCLEDSESGSPR